MLKLFNWDRHFDFKQIYPGCKINHFRRIEKHFSVLLNRMMFFDDEHRNINDLSPFGVCCVYVERGITWRLVEDALNNLKRSPKRK